jgi:hypothetical protein
VRRRDKMPETSLLSIKIEKIHGVSVARATVSLWSSISMIIDC